MFKVAIVGRPNVGKSSLFNRLLRQRLAVVDDDAGTTKDRIYADTQWLNQNFIIIDTGGLSFDSLPFQEKIKYQTQIAIQEADVIIFLTDIREGLVQEDLLIAKILYSKISKVVVAANKMDNVNLLSDIYNFYSLGFDEIVGISVLHGIGIGTLLDIIVSKRPSENTFNKVQIEDVVKFCVIGKPNVGKSTFTNSLLSQERMIVSDIPGTTTDAVNNLFQYKKCFYRIIDTAGLKKRGKIQIGKEKYSFLRTSMAILESDIVCFMIDVSHKISDQDKNIASMIFKANKPCIIIANKWDLVYTNYQIQNTFENNLRNELKFLDFMPLVNISALQKYNLDKFIKILDKVFDNYKRIFTDHILNDILYKAIQLNPPHIFNQGKARFYYLKQIFNKPPTFVCLVNDPQFIHFSYERFLKNQLRLNLELQGLPIKIIFKKKSNNL
ncbi:MAG: ribosome biogenesis GTPase Der [Pigeon pea little leaf phytoplasma]|uniref:GTPase Der n=1 Tax=Candidatus Phytoplasma fabacearum TaxID=2982628 RepID=A0ABU8ZTN3_9MOLU|nr:ribosome biogenesis GTPase Der ['Bituminaria bituminosa' little leaf phytoplasma]MDV3148809.1 ribosome biogenesis GTPase Der [Pigeon pea little leaf phytoplasma]MDO7983597.1 ribosome biogenesis GTPase Der ['Bituminaria bituminosa' little leaf phytoplasma]MDO8023752.1 ribosome biogenesis GTPase Der ['Bituminaria bituminosa' little leaf phytoplasma]MDO8030429.1 ribosome biogenesis GTPase Der ['Bituminaria bituminosa' little leaf phytoplasma]MDV3153950.1 ribosome biogenesis GTPase Der [Pigeon 